MPSGVSNARAASENIDPFLDAMGFDPVSIDALMERVDLPADRVIARLTELELDGALAALPGGRYQRLN